MRRVRQALTLLSLVTVLGSLVFALSLLLSPPATAQGPGLICDVICEPDYDPEPPATYDGTMRARPEPHNKRGGLGSESYSYSIPILSLPGRNGLDLNLTLYYNSRVWTIDKVNNRAILNADRDSPSYGFRLGFGYIEGTFSNSAGSTSYLLTEPSGGKRELRLSSGTIYESVDSSYVEYDSTTMILRRKDGTQWHYEQLSNTNIHRPIKIQDTNGNFISITYKTGTGFNRQSIDTITDTLGRVVTFNYDANAQLTSVTGPALGGGTQTYATFTWGQITLSYNFGSPLTVVDTELNNSSINVITRCTYANGTSYEFIYGGWGIVNTVEQESSGGFVRSSVSYNYPAGTTQVTDHPTFAQQTVNDGSNNGAWNYAVTKSGGLVSSFAVTDPAGTTATTNLFTSGWKTGLVDTVTITNGGTTYRTVTNEWTQDDINLTYKKNPRVTSLTTTNEGGQQSKVEFDYTANNRNVSEVREYDYGATAATRKTQADYLSDSNANYANAHILDRPKEIRVRDGSDALKAKTVFAYDTTTLSPSIAPVQWASPGSIRGNVTTITRYENAAAGAGAIIRSFTYDTAGNLRQADLDCCQARTWSFLSTNQYAYPDTITSGPAGGPLLITSRIYDVDTGLVLSSTDENQKKTSFEYDEMNRLKKVTRPDNIAITTVYDDGAAQPKTTTTTPIDATKSLVQVTTTDGLGRTIKQETKDGGGIAYSIVETKYDGLGRPTDVSNPYVGTPVDWTLNTYDPLGRIKTVIPPGSGGGYNYAYGGSAVTVVDPASKMRRTETDALGRLTQVEEPTGGTASGTAGQGSATVTGSVQSDAANGTPGTGWASVSGTLQSKQVETQPATSGTGSVSVSGSEQSTQVETQPATRGTGSVTISGSLQSTWIDPCSDQGMFPPCPEEVYDSGTVWITVNGVQKIVGYGQGSTASSVASALRSAINGDAGYPVTAGGSGTSVTLTAKATGASTNYSLSAGSSTNQNLYFSSPSFTATRSGSTLTGGQDTQYQTVYDSGTVWVTVNGVQKSVSYGQGSTASGLASALRSAINGDAGYPVTAGGSGTSVTLTARTTGASTNYSLSAGRTYDTANFSSPSFTATASGSTLTGGQDTQYQTVYDSGTVWVKVNGVQATVSYGQGSTASGLASALRTAINNNASMPVTASGTGTTVNLTAKSNGAGTNYTLSVGQNYDTAEFTSPSFTASRSGSALTGGTNLYDSGTVTVTVNGFPATASYGQSSTATSIATDLTGILNGASSPVNATQSGATINMTAKSTGNDTNYPLSTSHTYNSSVFSSPSFTASGSDLTGGTDPWQGTFNGTALTSYTYDVLDNLTQVSQGAQTRSFVYDGLGRLTQATTPESGQVIYSYTNFGQVATRQDARGVVTTYGYDGLHRLEQVSYNTTATSAVATPTVSFTYGTSAASNNNGRLTQMTDGTGSESYTYDQLGRITQVTKVIDAVSYPMGYAYNSAGALTSLTYPSGRVVQQSYDAIGRLSQVASGATNYVSGLQYNAAGQAESFSYGNSVSATLAYNARMQLSALSYTNGATQLLDLSYNYGTANNGQIQSITDNVDATRSMTYTYDELGRLKEATAGPTATPTWKLGWDYDRYGNRKNQNVLAGTAPAPQLAISTSTNRITSAGYSYDASGNLTNDAVHAYTFDAENRAISVDSGSTATSSYDGAGLRVKKVAGATTTVYIFSGSKVIAEYANSVLSKEYIYAGSQLVTTLEGGTPTYHHGDHLSVRVTTDSGGTKIGEQNHYPFGEAWNPSGTTSKWQFTSYERDSESGLDYAMFRYNSPRLGRFLTPDPLAGTILNPQSLNRYAYVLNDPVNLIDPLGLTHECQWECHNEGERLICEKKCKIHDDNDEGPGPGNSGYDASQSGRRRCFIGMFLDVEVPCGIFGGPLGGFGDFELPGQVRRPGESFTECWNRATAETYGAAGLPPDTEIAAAVVGTVGLAGSIKSVKGGLGGGWVRPSSALARRLAGPGHPGVVKAFRLAGKGLAVIGAAAAGVRIGAAYDCIQRPN